MFESTVKKPGRDLNMGRDSSWLIGADIVAVFLALVLSLIHI